MANHPALKYPPIPTMDADEFRAITDCLFRSGQAGLARWLNQDPRTIRRWAAGSHPIPTAIAILLRYLIHCGIDPARVRPYALKVFENEVFEDA